jgi:hypothetical protein
LIVGQRVARGCPPSHVEADGEEEVAVVEGQVARIPWMNADETGIVRWQDLERDRFAVQAAGRDPRNGSPPAGLRWGEARSPAGIAYPFRSLGELQIPECANLGRGAGLRSEFHTDVELFRVEGIGGDDVGLDLQLKQPELGDLI